MIKRKSQIYNSQQKYNLDFGLNRLKRPLKFKYFCKIFDFIVFLCYNYQHGNNARRITGE